MKLNLDVEKKDETAVLNFFQNSKYLILLAKDGSAKVLVLEG